MLVLLSAVAVVGDVVGGAAVVGDVVGGAAVVGDAFGMSQWQMYRI